MLKIRGVKEEDRGCYMCQINTEEMMKQIGCIDVLSEFWDHDRQKREEKSNVFLS